MGVGIPGTGMIGLPIAIALGALIGKSSYQLEVLKDLTPEATGIQAVNAGADGETWTAYSVEGKVVARGKGALPTVLREGVYIVRSGNSSKKLVVK